jgi:hypothetical protein
LTLASSITRSANRPTVCRRRKYCCSCPRITKKKNSTSRSTSRCMLTSCWREPERERDREREREREGERERPLFHGTALDFQGPIHSVGQAGGKLFNHRPGKPSRGSVNAAERGSWHGARQATAGKRHQSGKRKRKSSDTHTHTQTHAHTHTHTHTYTHTHTHTHKIIDTVHQAQRCIRAQLRDGLECGLEEEPHHGGPLE